MNNESLSSPSSEVEPPLDLDRLHQITRGKVLLQKRLLQAFVENAQMCLETIQEALAVNDCVTVEHQAHRIRGSSANVGVRMMPEVAGQLEQQGRQKTLSGAAEQLVILQRQLEQVKTFIQNQLPP